MSRNPNEMHHGISADHYCSDMYPQGVMQSDYVVFQPTSKKIEPSYKLTEQKPSVGCFSSHFPYLLGYWADQSDFSGEQAMRDLLLSISRSSKRKQINSTPMQSYIPSKVL